MLKYIIKRLLLAVLILLGVSLIIYILVRMMPTDYISQKIAAVSTSGNQLGPEAIEAMKAQYGLSDSSFAGILKGYGNWLLDLVSFDFGDSFVYSQPVVTVIKDNMGVSFAVAFTVGTATFCLSMVTSTVATVAL